MKREQKQINCKTRYFFLVFGGMSILTVILWGLFYGFAMPSSGKEPFFYSFLMSLPFTAFLIWLGGKKVKEYNKKGRCWETNSAF